ncbi:NADP-dependent malic enzyme-like [Zingiber officinale]|uniref:NADP-dependent malic enzyme-like n=1 Tax=Zingiber officinale TaxID=94328 RepID=UPI001C4D6EF6|nr:NADP-dependent malic enzyme-like [Zingiber officinale]
MSSHKDSLQHFKQPWAHDHEPVNNLVVIKVLLPQVPFWFLGSYIIVDDKNAFSNSVCTNSSGLSTKEVVEAMANFNEIQCTSSLALILAQSNPTSQSECSVEEAYTWSKVKFGFHSHGQAIFASGSPFDPIEYDGKVLVPGQDNLDKGMVYPPFPNIRKIFAYIAANVAAKV